MAPLGPFAGDRRIAVAVSGGADSMTLALLLRGWGRPFALVVDHGLRPASAAEAGMTLQRLAAMGIPARLLQADLRHGPALAERARAARYALLGAACRDAGLVDLALGHHLRDQAETVLLRRAAGSGAAGLSGMSAVAHTDAVRLLRPLLKVPPARLRATLAAAGVEWVEDPTNADPATPRARLRAGPLADPAAAPPLGAEAAASGVARAAAEAEAAAELAASVAVHPEGVAHIQGSIGPQAVSTLVWTLSGAAYPPSLAAALRLSGGLSGRLRAEPGWAGTLHGVSVIPAGRFGQGWLMGREAAAMQEAVPANCRWDGRFQAAPSFAPAEAGDGTTLGALGPDAARLRRWSALPSALLRTLPTLRRDGAIVAVPHLRYPDAAACCGSAVMFRPARPVAPAAFFAA
jgi:tRNA(Ile)-lysidine synthase